MSLIATGARRPRRHGPPNRKSYHPPRRRGDPTGKRRGEATEAEFIARATGPRLPHRQAWEESDSYDVLVGIARGFWRVQVKRAPYLRQGQYVANAKGNSRLYTKEDIDFIAAHLIQQNIWYIVPIEAFAGRTMLHFNPQSRLSKSKYEKYREAWCLLACPEKARGWKDIPVLCRCQALPIRCAVCPKYDTKCGTDTPVRRR